MHWKYAKLNREELKEPHRCLEEGKGNGDAMVLSECLLVDQVDGPWGKNAVSAGNPSMTLLMWVRGLRHTMPIFSSVGGSTAVPVLGSLREKSEYMTRQLLY
ncbi:hypothetical protein TraAM80_08601 [Trypanosoma rangeli]|uniref:Uncharacterized protein n=1 Tax=Trypanosoma rangeli TaxID=5698 RepID=A0A3R7KPF6_TRYRA|nr:uncharacterized protein TraAM80_08601 [Trypanosoma rangeli]RNE98754.1 hypothetical protein TraAM80_08601 [Trypanosoma rangeli]|eukprot:RNE98754.1 hypothetical protein TraAM80_08601 [Trypanosoma rangeli]